MNESNELDWLAFQYIADELPSTEAAAFERRLGEDQEAREAVARAVELSQAAAAALDMQPISTQGNEPLSQPAGRSIWTASFGSGALWWMSCGAAACLAIVVGYQAWMGMNPGQPAINATSPELAEAWSVAREQLGTDSPELPLASYSEEAAGDEPDPMATPSWLVAALNPDEEPPAEGSTMEDEMLNPTPGTKGEG